MFKHGADGVRHMTWDRVPIEQIVRRTRLNREFLTPNIVEAILDGKQGSEVTLAGVLEPLPSERSE